MYRPLLLMFQALYQKHACASEGKYRVAGMDLYPVFLIQRTTSMGLQSFSEVKLLP